MINCVPCNALPDGISGSKLNREEHNLQDIGENNPNFDTVTWGWFKNCSEMLYPEWECDYMNLCAFCANTCSVSAHCQTYFNQSAQSQCAPGFCPWTVSVLPSNAEIVSKVFFDELSDIWTGPSTTLADQRECRWECQNGFKTVFSSDQSTGVVASCIHQSPGPKTTGTISNYMDPNMSHCNLTALWSDIISGSTGRYKTGGLGKLIIDRVYVVWVCDKLDPCLNSTGVSAGDYMCYVYNEVSHEFEALALNSRIKFVGLSSRRSISRDMVQTSAVLSGFAKADTKHEYESTR
jgi:hypothetical protein